MRHDTLAGWLAWLETLHPKTIDLGLERVGAVANALGIARLPCPVITVAGTNGKGSCVAMLEALLGAAGRRVATYTSPHLLRYNERVRIAGREATDAELCDAFARVERARGGISLTYFEFGTLAALDLIIRASPDVAVLEVGLGGRLDASTSSMAILRWSPRSDSTTANGWAATAMRSARRRAGYFVPDGPQSALIRIHPRACCAWPPSAARGCFATAGSMASNPAPGVTRPGMIVGPGAARTGAARAAGPGPGGQVSV
jgi:hypothetical protein